MDEPLGLFLLQYQNLFLLQPILNAKHSDEDYLKAEYSRLLMYLRMIIAITGRNIPPPAAPSKTNKNPELPAIKDNCKQSYIELKACFLALQMFSHLNTDSIIIVINNALLLFAGKHENNL